MSELFDLLKQGLEQAIEYEKGNKSAGRSTRISVKPIPEYTSTEIKKIRNSLQITQWAFADLLGVSTKTVEAWESGSRKPTGSAMRLIQIITNNSGIERQIIEYHH